ncbi:RFXANK isoform 6, partial [Pan troglodytes]
PEALTSPPKPTLATPRWTLPWPWDTGKVIENHILKLFQSNLVPADPE